MAERQRVLLVGWAGADWDLVHQVWDRGAMPNLKRLAAAGVSGTLMVPPPLVSSMLWTSAVTGKRPAKHGITGYARPLLDGSGIEPVRSTHRQASALWNILSQRGIRAHVVNWWASDPAEAISGVSISERFCRLPGGVHESWPVPAGSVSPADLAATLAEVRIRPEELDVAALAAFVPDVANTDPQKDPRIIQCAVILAETVTAHAAATWAMENRPWDFMAVGYTGIDRASRQFLRYSPPHAKSVSNSDSALYQHVVSAMYAFHDMMLGRLLELAGEDTTIILISDHGYLTGDARPLQDPRNAQEMEAFCRPQGIVVAAGPGIGKTAIPERATLLDVTPTVLSLLGLPAGADMDGTAWPCAVAAQLPAAVPTWDCCRNDTDPQVAEGEEDPEAAIDYLLELGYTEAATDPGTTLANKTRDENRWNLVRSHLDAGQFGEAIPLLERLFRIHPLDMRFGKTLFDSYLVLQRWEDCRRLAQGVLDRGGNGPHIALAHLGLGIVCAAQKQPDRAAEHLHQAEAMETPTAGYLLLLGQAYLQNRSWAEAQRTLDRVVASDPGCEAAWYGLAIAATAQEHYEDAVEYARRAISLRDTNASAHYHLGVALQKVGLYRDAVNALERCVQLDPELLPAYRKLEEISRGAMGDAFRARMYWQRAQDVIARRQIRRKPNRNG